MPEPMTDIQGSGATIEAFTRRVAHALAGDGVRRLDWSVSLGRLVLRLEPEGLLPCELWISPDQEGQAAYMRSGAVMVLHDDAGDDAFDEASRDLLRRFAEAILVEATAEVLDALDRYPAARETFARVDPALLVRRGFSEAAIIPTRDEPSVLAALRRDLAVIEPSGDERAAVDRFWGASEKEKMVFIARSEQTVQRLQTLERELRLPATDRAGSQEELGLLLGLPRCCAARWTKDLWVPEGVPDQVFVAGAMAARAGTGPLPEMYSPLTNFLGAEVHQLSFFQHLPCSPTCGSTVARNRELLDALYDEDQRTAIRSMLSTSYLVWPDGTMTSFRIRAPFEGGEIAVADFGQEAWPETTMHKFRAAARVDLPIRRPHGQVDALRVVRDRWEVRTDGKWQALVDRTGWFRRPKPFVVLVTDERP